MKFAARMASRPIIPALGASYPQLLAEGRGEFLSSTLFVMVRQRIPWNSIDGPSLPLDNWVSNQRLLTTRKADPLGEGTLEVFDDFQAVRGAHGCNSSEYTSGRARHQTKPFRHYNTTPSEL